MPRFLDPSNPALNTLVKVKREVNKRNQKKVSLYPDLKVGPQGQSEADLALYEGFLARVSAIYTATTELFNVLFLSRSGRGTDLVIDRFVGSAANLGRMTRDLEDYFFRKMNRSFNRFTPAELQKSAQYVTEIQSRQEDTDKLLYEMEDDETRDNITETLESNYSNDLDELLDLIVDSIVSYKYGSRGDGSGGADDGSDQYSDDWESASSASSRSGRGRGGAALYSREPVPRGGAVASRVGLQFGNPFTTLGKYPPRNTQDLHLLPRRFL